MNLLYSVQITKLNILLVLSLGIYREAFELNKSPSQAAEELCELAIKLGSNDNVTVVITRFMHSV